MDLSGGGDDESASLQKWTLKRSSATSRCIRMPVPRHTSAKPFDTKEWQLSERTVKVSDSPCEDRDGGDDAAVSNNTTERAPGRSSIAPILWWLTRIPIFWSSFDSDEERAYRPRINIVTKAMLRTVVVLMLAWQIGMSLYMAIGGFYDLTMFTFWNYTMTTVLVFFLAASLFYERILLTFTLLFLFPMVFGTDAVVRFGIVLIVGRNADVFLGDGSQSIEMRYVGDFVVHSLPLGMLLVVLITGLLLYVRRALGYNLGLFRTSLRWWLYVAYVLFSPLLPLSIYTASFSIEKTYPTGYSTGFLWFVLVVVCAAWQGFFLLIFVAVAKFSIEFTSFWIHRHQGESNSSSVLTKPFMPPVSERL